MSATGEQPETQSGDGKSARAVSRRGLLGKGAGAAAAGIGLAVLTTEPAHAAAGNPVVLGQANDAGSTATSLVSTNATALRVTNNSTATGASTAIEARGRSLGLVGITPDTGDPATDTGTGVIGEGGCGVQAVGRQVGLRAAGPVPLRLEPAHADGPPTVGAHIVGDVYNDARGHVYLCVAAGTPGTWVQPGFNPVPPFRVLDTRSGIGVPSATPLGPGQEIEVTFWGVAGVVPGATAVTGNLTVVRPTAAGFLTVYPSGMTRPATSNISFVANQAVANQMTVKLGTDGKVRVFNSAGSTHVVIDLAGFYY